MVQQLGNITHLIAASGVWITVDDVVVVIPEGLGAVGELDKDLLIPEYFMNNIMAIILN